MNKDSVKENLWIVGVIIIIVGAVLFGLYWLDGADSWYNEWLKEFVRILNPYNYHFLFPCIFLMGIGVVVVYFAKFDKE